MVRECFKTNSGIIFHTELLREIGLDPSTIYPLVLPRPPALFDLAKTQVVEEPPYTSFFAKLYNFFARSSGANVAQLDAQKITFTNEEEEELRDALSPKYDQLSISWSWWILEILPMSVRYQKNDNQWMSTLKYVNLVSSGFVDLKLLAESIWEKVDAYQSGSVLVSKSTDRSSSEWKLSLNEKERSINPGQIPSSNLNGSTDLEYASSMHIFLFCTITYQFHESLLMGCNSTVSDASHTWCNHTTTNKRMQTFNIECQQNP